MSFLKVGDKAPDFQLKNQREETICLDSYRHKSNIVLLFLSESFDARLHSAGLLVEGYLC